MSSGEHDHPLFASQVDFASEQVHEGSPETEFLLHPDRSVELQFFNRELEFDDGARHEIWSFESPTSGRGLPAPTLRVTEGEIFHARIKPGKGPHTIHWHGIEPDPRNDGVGHTSFEVTGGYTYQWIARRGAPGDPNIGAAGTYFYHCHVNTVLHVQMGMFGPVVIDPAVHPDYPVQPGLTRRPFVDGPEYDVATEAALIPFSVDPRWHRLDHAAGLSGEDVGLNRFEPEHFYLLGGELARPRRGGVWSLDRLRANVQPDGQPGRQPGQPAPTLLRTVNANYFPIRMRFFGPDGQPSPFAELVGHDGREYRDTSDPNGPSPVLRDTGHRLLTDHLAFGSAERYDLLLFPPTPGTYAIQVQWEHWITREPLATRVVPVDVV